MNLLYRTMPQNLRGFMTRQVCTNSFRLHKFLFTSFILISVSLLSLLAPVPSFTVKPLRLTQNITVPRSSQTVVMFDVEVLAADPMARTLTLDWYPYVISKADCTSGPLTVYDIYMSPDIIDASSPYWSGSAPYPPLMQINTSDMCTTMSIFTSSPTFRTVTKLLASAPQRQIILNTLGEASLQDYPFDVYIAPMILWVIDQRTGEMSAPGIARTYGVAVNFEVSLPSIIAYESPYSFSPVQSQLWVTFRVERSIATKTFVLMIAITSWLTAITFTIMCAAAIVYRPHGIYSEMFVLPVGVVFAFASIRQNLPGAPNGFGTTLDVYTTLPFLVIMTFTGITLILLVLFRRIREHYAPEKKEEPLGKQNLEATGTDTGTISASKKPFCPQGHAIGKEDEENVQNSEASAESAEYSSSSEKSIDATRIPTPESNKMTDVHMELKRDEEVGVQQESKKIALEGENKKLKEEGKQVERPPEVIAKADVAVNKEAA